MEALGSPVASIAAASPGVLVSAPFIIPTARGTGIPNIFIEATHKAAPEMIVTNPITM